MQNPFTTTFSKMPDYTYIPTEQTAKILENFSYDIPSESVYKITGVRGSGKTVLLGKIEAEMSSDDYKEHGWLVYRLNPTRDMLGQLAALLYKEGFTKDRKKSRSINMSANVMGSGGGIGISSTERDEFFDIGVEIDGMLSEAKKKGKKILIGIDEVSRTPEMESFASEFGMWLRSDYPVYLVCTGLYENIEQLYNVKNLTFFRRATTIKTEPLNHIRMSEMYRQKLSVEIDEARRLAELTKGYPYAFQELGVLYFGRSGQDESEEIINQLQAELFAYAYEKIWEELSTEDRKLVTILAKNGQCKREEIIKEMEKPGNYSTYRDRLLKRGIITARHSYITLALPFFGEYINEYCM